MRTRTVLAVLFMAGAFVCVLAMLAVVFAVTNEKMTVLEAVKSVSIFGFTATLCVSMSAYFAEIRRQ